LDVDIIFTALIYHKNTGIKRPDSELHTIAAFYSSLSFAAWPLGCLEFCKFSLWLKGIAPIPLVEPNYKNQGLQAKHRK
jgi:hypothetical protein